MFLVFMILIIKIEILGSVRKFIYCSNASYFSLKLVYRVPMLLLVNREKCQSFILVVWSSVSGVNLGFVSRRILRTSVGTGNLYDVGYYQQNVTYA